MIAWTDSAKKIWADYNQQTRAALEGTGADPQEVLDDLKRHIDEAAAQAKLAAVTEEDLRRMLARFGSPQAAKLEAGGPPQKESRPASGIPGKLGWAGLFFLGILLPTITIAFEWFTGVSAAVLFDPIPTWVHVVMVAMVPVGNAWLWSAARRGRSRHEIWLGWLSGFGLGVCIYYSFLYMLFLPFAFCGLLYFGLGMIPLTPYLSLLAGGTLRFKYCQTGQVRKLRGYTPGIWLALICLLLLQLPESLTYYGLSRARSEDQATRDSGIKVLRVCGSHTVMLRACYGWLAFREMFQPFNLLAMGGDQHDISSDAAREIYYRVTGESFNSVPAPTFYTRAGRWTELDDEYVWDAGLGGDQVAGRIKGLSLLSSRMDATTEPNAGLAYCEWTMEFKNVSALQREARAEIALPPGAVVSRVTLWINGEEREAAFGGRSQTRTAYQEEAVKRRRDPLLVTTCGPDRVLVQCFPIPPNGGIMKIRLGMTAPLILDSLASGNFVWPHFLERNFSLAANFKHSLWLEQPGEDNAMVGSHETLAETNLSASLHATVVHRRAEVDTVWTPGPTNGQFILQTIHPIPTAAPGRVVIVLDGSAGMKNHVAEISREIGQLPETTEVAVIMASDESEPFKSDVMEATAANKSELQRLLRKAIFTGGQDNLPALESAWDLADEAGTGRVVWIHLPEAVQLSSESGMCQRLQRNRKSTRLYEVQLNNGPDRLVEKFDGLPSTEPVVSMTAGENGFDRLLNLWSGHSQAFVFNRKLTNDMAGLAAERRASKHLARLWAHDESLRLADLHRVAEAAKLAAQSQLVTPFTGAVVLENQAQYNWHNLSPADPSTVPDIPEPANLMMVALVIGALMVWHRRRVRREQD